MKILVIDDDPLIIEFVRRGLMEDGYVLDAAVTASEGLLCARIGSYDAIILDIGLPDASGLDVAREMRRESDATPILLLTARTGTDNLVDGLDAGADDYLTKPFDIRELRARLRALTRRGGSTRAETVRMGALTLDRLDHEVRIGDTPLRLTPKEYLLLEYFILRPGTVITRTELLEKVWEMNFDPQSNIVDVHVARLRSKLRDSPGVPQLETVRGFGFRLSDAAAGLD
ncbi:MAG TPA: response regulator transcription factor [Longimicrobiales bacterium]|nr:response regulator transcription factor [Longimicrobiales bacterium]